MPVDKLAVFHPSREQLGQRFRSQKFFLEVQQIDQEARLGILIIGIDIQNLRGIDHFVRFGQLGFQQQNTVGFHRIADGRFGPFVFG